MNFNRNACGAYYTSEPEKVILKTNENVELQFIEICIVYGFLTVC